MSWHVQQKFGCESSSFQLLWKNPSENKKNIQQYRETKRLQASSLGQTKKCPWWNDGKSPLTPKTSTWRPQYQGERVWHCQMARKRVITSLVFMCGWQHYRVGDFRSTQFRLLVNKIQPQVWCIFLRVIKGDYTILSWDFFCRGWAHFVRRCGNLIYRQKTLQQW